MLLGKGKVPAESGTLGSEGAALASASAKAGEPGCSYPLQARGHASFQARWLECCAGCLLGTPRPSQARPVPWLPAWLREGISDLPGPSSVGTAAANGVSRAGLPAPSRAEVAHLHGPTEIRGLQGPWEPSGLGLHCGALAESLGSGGTRSPELCLLQQPVCTAGGNPRRRLLLGCPGLSTLQGCSATQPTTGPWSRSAGSFAFCSGENFSALPLPRLKSTNHSIY